jgi:tripartite-type tricarboxylate transporter receptor subunit TctC
MRNLTTGTVLAFFLGANGALADYPERDLQGIIMWGAGGATDTVSRALQPHVEERLGARIVMSNRTGGSGAIATRFVQGQRPDGYTLLFGAENPQIYKVMGLADVDYGDFFPVNIPARSVVVIAVPADSPWQTLEDLVEDVQSRPDEVRMGGTGPGGLMHVVLSMIRSATEFEVTTVPFDGEGPGLTAMLGGAVDFMPAGMPAVGAMIEGGRARALAVVDDEPFAALPDVPPITDTFPALEAYLPWGPFYGVFAHQDAPEEAKEVLVQVFSEAVGMDEFTELMEARGNVMLNLHGEEARTFLDEWQSVTSWLIYEAGGAEHSPEEFGIPRP